MIVNKNKILKRVRKVGGCDQNSIIWIYKKEKIRRLTILPFHLEGRKKKKYERRRQREEGGHWNRLLDMAP